MTKRVDLRSDTITVPTEEMLASILQARLGDSLRDEDETVRELEEKAARMFGKEAGLLLISGTMANQVAIAAHTERGDVIVSPSVSHIARKEKVSTALISGCAVFESGDERGFLDPDDVTRIVKRGRELAGGRISLATAENTVNAPGGVIYPSDILGELASRLEALNVPLHLDGSRIFNALVETGEDPKAVGNACTTLTFCLSKGLGAPLGSVLAGSRAFIERAKEWRNFLGGGMRQAGVIAACGLYALSNHVDRLAEDHQKARNFAETISQSEKIDVLNAPVQTNMIIFTAKNLLPDKFERELARRGILLDFRRSPILRAVTHINVSFEEVEQAAEAIVDVLEKQ